MKLDDFCREVEKRLQTGRGQEEKLAIVAEALRTAFRVRTDEVSIFGFFPDQQILRFLWPRHLQQAGIIPLAARHSLVCRTFVENRPTADNRFGSSTHLSVFELVPETRGSGMPLPIQKILSAPIGKEGGFRGVVQVCRKGEDPEKAGADFSPVELNALIRLAEVMARYLEFHGPDSNGGAGACAS